MHRWPIHTLVSSLWSPNPNTNSSPLGKTTVHTIAYSMPFPSETATRSPFLTPPAVNPRASALLFRSSSWYVNRRLWCFDTTLNQRVDQQSGEFRLAWEELGN